MPDPVAATPIAPPAAGAPAQPPSVIVDPRLPEGVVLKNTLSADIDRFFDGPEGGQPAASVVPAPAPVVAPKAPAATNSVVGKLASKSTPAAPTAAKPTEGATPEGGSPDDVVAKIEADFIRHNPKWKPAEGWTALKTTLKSEADRRVQLERELTETKAKLTSPVVAGMTVQEVEKLRAEAKEASDRLLVLDLQNHPSFQAQFVAPKQQEIARITELLGAHNVKIDVAALLAKPRAELGKAVAEAIKDVPEFDRVEVAESIRKAYSLEQGAREALGKSREVAGALQVQSVERSRKAFATRWAPVSAAIGEFAQPVETPADATPEQRALDQSYNKALSELQTKAESIALGTTSDESVAEAAIKAAAYDLHIGHVLPRVVSEYEQLAEINRGLVAELNAIRGRNPNHSLSASPNGNNSPVTDPAKMDHAQAADHFFRA